uniref:Uncharacterized protein n=1 Tax=Strigamia maritima TaxID=126957 RepID=T1JMI8_STRMM
MFADPTQVVPNGTVMYHNGVPYTYQNGMAFFTSPESSYSFPQPQQAAYPMIYPQPVYLQQQQYQYQTPTPTAQPQWTAGNQWRWAPPVNFGQNPNLPATQYIYPHNAATAASPALSVSHAASDGFQYAQAAHAPYQPPAADLADISIMEATSAEESIGLMESQRASNKSMNRQQVSSSIDFHVLPIEQGSKNFKKPGGSPRKAYTPTGNSRLQQQQHQQHQHQHRQKFMATKHVNGLHILTYSPSDKPEDLMHVTEAGMGMGMGMGMSPAGGPLTPPSTPMTSAAQDSSIIDATLKLQALNL